MIRIPAVAAWAGLFAVCALLAGSPARAVLAKRVSGNLVFWDQARVRNLDDVTVDPGRLHLNSVGAGARIAWNRFLLDATMAYPLTRVGPLDRRPGPRILVSLTTRLWPWKY